MSILSPIPFAFYNSITVTSTLERKGILHYHLLSVSTVRICIPATHKRSIVMLGKKPGVKKIHLLQIIGLVEADFNTALKLYFAKHLILNSEKTKLIDE